MKTLYSSKRRHHSRHRAFTLVEVVLALGVASFGLISMLGLLSVGLKTFHDAINATTEAEITQQLANQLRLASFSSVQGVTTPSTYYFNQEGVATNASSAIYFASVNPPSKLAVPGGSSVATTQTNTLTFVISVWSKSSPQATNATPIHIANNGS